MFEPFFLLGRQVGAAVDEVFVGLCQQAHLLGGKAECFALFIDGFDACEQSFVQHDAVLEVGEERRHFVGDSIHFVVSVGFENVIEHAYDAFE